MSKRLLLSHLVLTQERIQKKLAASKIVIRLMLSNLPGEVEIDGPTLLTEKMISKAYNVLNDLLMDMIDDAEITDEEFRELFIQLCYYLMLQEMQTLHLLPLSEQSFKERLES